MLLIVTNRTDLTADYMITFLQKEGLPYFRLNSDEMDIAFPEVCLGTSKEDRTIIVGPRRVNLNEVSAVWYRRAVRPHATRVRSISEAHFLSGELRHLFEGILYDDLVTWINPMDSVEKAEHKLYQLRVARDLGFEIPKTLVSRNPEEVLRFQETAGPLIVKPIFHGHFGVREDAHGIYTRRIERSDLDPDVVFNYPSLFQEEIKKGSDLRVTVIGDQLFAVDISSETTPVDWRRPDLNIQYRLVELPDAIRSRCFELLARLNLRYGAIDFVLDPSGRYVFLEINPTGEWAWLEDRMGLPLRQAFVDLFLKKWRS